jgi:UDP-N-acetyl-D-mannosaminuronic acid dehydrogenase
MDYDICVVGGCGHVGLPLAISFARSGLRVAVDDIDDRAVETVRAGRMPFLEDGAEPALKQVIGRTLHVANDPALVGRARHVIVVIGTPVDEHLNPTFHAIRRFFAGLLPRLVDGQCLILRSTVYPGTTEKVRDMVAASGKRLHVAFCPERVAQGKAMGELAELPQIVAGCDEKAVAMAGALFGRIARSVIRMSPLEAELTKIFANVWRYIQFATANQFFMIATDFGADFYRIHDALTRDYPRMAGLPSSGFAAGPCLFKDTMQLAAANNNNFSLGHSAMLINEGLPNYLVRQVKQKFDLGRMRVGLLGMAFKGDCDDPRESLSYKLRKVLQYEAAEVLCTDVYIKDPSFLPLDEVVARSDLLVVGAPHREYRALAIPDPTPVVDIWNIFGKGVFHP